LQHDINVSGEAELSYGDCLTRVATAAARAGKQSGILCRDIAELAGLFSLGFRWIAVDSDLGLLRAGFQRAIRQSLET
jgi:2-keto-3-deoxy-L-rhamnonate aldolase RhmA